VGSQTTLYPSSLLPSPPEGSSPKLCVKHLVGVCLKRQLGSMSVCRERKARSHENMERVCEGFGVYPDRDRQTEHMWTRKPSCISEIRTGSSPLPPSKCPMKLEDILGPQADQRSPRFGLSSWATGLEALGVVPGSHSEATQ
jgi:hypothetical protein